MDPPVSQGERVILPEPETGDDGECFNPRSFNWRVIFGNCHIWFLNSTAELTRTFSLDVPTPIGEKSSVDATTSTTALTGTVIDKTGPTSQSNQVSLNSLIQF